MRGDVRVTSSSSVPQTASSCVESRFIPKLRSCLWLLTLGASFVWAALGPGVVN